MAKKKEKRSLTGVFNNVMGEATPKQESQEEKPAEEEPEKVPEPEVETQEEKPQEEASQEVQEEGVIAQFKEKKQRKKTEDTHTRVTFLVRNDLKAEIDKLFKRFGYGFKTHFINSAIEAQLKEIKEELESNKKK